MNEYRITNRLSLFTVAKIIAFDIATLSSLSFSMYEDVSMLLALRLRGNANSLDRAGERNRRTLEQESRAGDDGDASIEAAIAEAERMAREANTPVPLHTPAPETQPNAATASATEPAATPAPAPETPSSPARTPTGQPQAARADAMTTVAEAFTAALEDPPRDKPRNETARINPLTTRAGDPASGAAPPAIPAMAAE